MLRERTLGWICIVAGSCLLLAAGCSSFNIDVNCMRCKGGSTGAVTCKGACP